MAGIAKRVQVFNEAYRAGWELLEADEQHQVPDTATRLKDNICVLMNAGWDNPQEIARTIAERMRSHHRRG